MAKNEKLIAVKGMNDILPPDSARWEWFEAKVRDLMGRFAYRNMRTPIVEPTALFVRGLGEVTDIVEKEMYSFEDRADKHGQAEHLDENVLGHRQLEVNAKHQNGDRGHGGEKKEANPSNRDAAKI